MELGLFLKPRHSLQITSNKPPELIKDYLPRSRNFYGSEGHIMAKFSRVEVINEILRIGVVPVFYHADIDIAKKVVEACAAAGLRVIEFTNRGDNAWRVFSDLVQYFAADDPGVILGVGSVVDPGTGALYISSGANFVVGPVLNPELARICNRRKISYSPGCGSASEISQAEELGAEIVKIFPGDSVGGPKFVKSILAPMPWSRLMPTGGVDSSRESLEAWFKAGVAAVGVGSNLVRSEWVAAGEFDKITDLGRKMIGWVRLARGQSPFIDIEHVGLYGHGGVTGEDIANWYHKLFGFELEENLNSILVGGMRPGSIDVSKEGKNERCHIAVRVADFDEAIAHLRALGIEFGEPKIGPGSKAVFLKNPDPAGNLVHLIWRT
jgi:2-dehydro-3-deoxyphosphogluconate aldolase/(4S)-4-hydroxy-2-oxoglutarate aldolase